MNARRAAWCKVRPRRATNGDDAHEAPHDHRQDALRHLPPRRLRAPTQLVPRHSALVRLTHWINVFCFSLLLMTGAQIFNAHPRLYWGEYGADNDHAWLSIDSLQRRRRASAASCTSGALDASSRPACSARRTRTAR